MRLRLPICMSVGQSACLFCRQVCLSVRVYKCQSVYIFITFCRLVYLSYPEEGNHQLDRPEEGSCLFDMPEEGICWVGLKEATVSWAGMMKATYLHEAIAKQNPINRYRSCYVDDVSICNGLFAI